MIKWWGQKIKSIFLRIFIILNKDLNVSNKGASSKSSTETTLLWSLSSLSQNSLSPTVSDSLSQSSMKSSLYFFASSKGSLTSHHSTSLATPKKLTSLQFPFRHQFTLTLQPLHSKKWVGKNWLLSTRMIYFSSLIVFLYSKNSTSVFQMFLPNFEVSLHCLRITTLCHQFRFRFYLTISDEIVPLLLLLL